MAPGGRRALAQSCGESRSGIDPGERQMALNRPVHREEVIAAPVPFGGTEIEQYRAIGAWGDQTLWDHFLAKLESTPDRIALVDDPRRAELVGGSHQRLTYQEAYTKVVTICAYMRAHGLKRGDVVLTYLPNVVEQALVLLAAWRTGVIVSPMLIQFQQREVTAIVERARPKAVFTTARFGKRRLADEIADMLPVQDRPIIFSWGETELADVVEMDRFPEPDEIADEAKLTRFVDPDSIATICWTSGTEGAPKGVIRTHNNWLTTARGIVEGGGLQGGDILLNPFPFVNMASVGGIFAPWLLTGGTFVLHMPFDLETMFEQIESESVNYSVIAPAILRQLVDSGTDEAGKATFAKLASLRALGTGSAPLEASVFKGVRANLGIELTNFFGSNEGLSLISGPQDCPDLDQRAITFPRVGQPQFKWRVSNANWCRTRLTDPETGEEITETGRPGLLRMKGPSIFAGYFNRGAVDRSSFDEEGYFISGDLFEIVERNGEPDQYRFVGRHKDIVIRGGMNIAPSELDNLLSEYPPLKDVAVTGFPDDQMGEKICACIVPKTGANVGLDDLSEFLISRKISRYKLPEAMLVVDQIPRSPLGKILRPQLREMVIASPEKMQTRKNRRGK